MDRSTSASLSLSNTKKAFWATNRETVVRGDVTRRARSKDLTYSSRRECSSADATRRHLGHVETVLTPSTCMKNDISSARQVDAV